MASPVRILGISAYYHDSAAALVVDGEIVAAASEERFTRTKGDPGFPANAVAYCLRQGGIGIGDLACVGFYEKPLLKFDRIVETFVGAAPGGFAQFALAAPLWFKEKLWQDRALRAALGGYQGELLYAEHHESHAASAFYPSPFENSAIVTMDGVGEWATAAFGVGRDSDVQLLKEMRWPDSLGLLYSAFTYYTGFKVNSGEYKVMGLAPYGEPTYVQQIYDHLLDLREDGSFRLNLEYFGYVNGLTMTNAKFHRLFGGPPRAPETTITQRDMNLARSVQEVCEEIVLRTARAVRRETGLENLCLAGGVALNAVANGKLLREGPFRRVWIQPAAGDSGGALGVAQLVWHRHFGQPRTVTRGADAMRGALLGPEFSDADIETFLIGVGATYTHLDREDLLRRTARLLADGNVVGWFNGRMEFGPRALGARSILGDPRDPAMQTRMNVKIKFREGFRPFAPSVLSERAREYFELDADSPYMTVVAPVKRERRVPVAEGEQGLRGIDRLKIVRSDIPAVTHVDYSARVQTVHRAVNPDYYDLICEFERLTGCAVLVNTSFNVRGEPIVCTPAEAYACYMRTQIDALVMGRFLLQKTDLPTATGAPEWHQEVQLD